MPQTFISKAAQKPANAVGFSGTKLTAWGSISMTDAVLGTTGTSGPASGDVFRLVRLPLGAVVVGGRLYASRFATGTSSGSTTVALNIGLSGSFKDTIFGTSYGATTASGCFGSGIGVDFTETTTGSVKYESGLSISLGGLLYSVGPLKLSEDQFAQVIFVGSATSWVSGGTLTLGVDYYMPTHV